MNILGHFLSKLIFSTSSPEPQLRMVSKLIYKYLGWFSLRFVHFVSISWILFFWWIFWVIFDKNWYFQLLRRTDLKSECFQIWYAKYLRWFSLRFVHFRSTSLFSIFGEYFLSKLIFSTTSSNRHIRMLLNLIYKYLGWFSLRFVHFLSKSRNLHFLWIFLPFWVKVNIFNFFFARTSSQNAFKFNIQAP